jgi:uncharacterized membrane protein (UPF0127 family)
MNILLNDKKYPLEIKVTPKEKSKGMMNRHNLNGGMLFIFDEPQEQTFWMKNCLIKLDIVMVNNGVVDTIHENCDLCDENCKRYKGFGNMVLEFKGGFCKKNNLSVGDRIEFVY